MPIYRMDASGNFVPFEETPFGDFERVLEDWIEANPHLLLDGERMAIIGRQTRTAFGKIADLLGIDETGALVIIELKRGETPREVVAQVLEYAAWIDSLALDQLDAIAAAYAATRGNVVTGVADIYRSAFHSSLDRDERAAAIGVEQTASEFDDDELDDEAEDDDEVDGEILSRDLFEHITPNHRQRLIIVAEQFSGEVEQTLRYLRTRLGVDVSGVQFSIHTAGGETIVHTNVVVGREPPIIATGKTPKKGTSARGPEADDSIMARAKTEFVRKALTSLEDWLDEKASWGFELRHGAGSNHYLSHRGRRQLTYYYASSWLRCVLYAPKPREIDVLRARLSKPDQMTKKRKGRIGFHVASDGDLFILQELLLERTARSNP